MPGRNNNRNSNFLEDSSDEEKPKNPKTRDQIESDYDDEINSDAGENGIEEREKIQGHKKGKKKNYEDEDDDDDEMNGKVQEEHSGDEPEFEPSFIKTYVTFLISGSIDQFSVNHSSDKKCCGSINGPLKMIKNGEVIPIEGPQLIKGISIVEMNNKYNLSVGPLVTGVEFQQSNIKFSSSGQIFHALCTPNTHKKNMKEKVFQFDINKGMKFLRNFPGFTTDKLRDPELITPFKNKGYLVHKSHPVMSRIYDIIEGGQEIELSTVADNYFVDKETADTILEEIEKDMRSFMPLVKLEDIKVELIPAFPESSKNSNKQDISYNPWINNHEISAMPEIKRKDVIKQQGSCYVTLEIEHCPPSKHPSN